MTSRELAEWEAYLRLDELRPQLEQEMMDEQERAARLRALFRRASNGNHR